MKVIEVDTSNHKHVNNFLDLPFRLYSKTPQWAPPLMIDARRMLDRQKNPYFRHSEAAFFLAYDGDLAVGRLAVLNNKNYNEFNQARSAFFYLFECIDHAETASAMFARGFEWARHEGLNLIEGPKGFSVLDGLGMLVKGFEYRPAFGLPYNLPYYPALVENSGFTRSIELVSGYLDATKVQFPEKIHQVAELLQKRRGLHVEHYRTRRELRAVVPHLKKLYNGALAGTSGTTPLTDAEVQGMAEQMLWFADPNLIKIVMKGDQPVGFLLAYPDITEALQRTRGRLFPFGWLTILLELKKTPWININGAGMIEGYRGLGGTALLFDEMFKSVRDSRYRYADLVQIGVENSNMQRELRDLGIDFYKTHRVYQREIS